VLGGEVAGNGLGDVSKGVELLGGDQVGEAVPDGFSVSWRRGLDDGSAGVGKEDVEAARIVVAQRSLDRAAALHAGDLMGEPTAFPAQPSAQVAGPEASAWRFGDGYEDGVVSFGEPAVLAELAGQVSGQLDTQALETTPGTVLALVQPSWFHGQSVLFC
jgi:hypothetical protein